MLYYLLKYISKAMMRVYFGKVYIDGLEKVPKDKPLILAANHQSAFIEPVLLGGIMPFPVHFITRGDVFVKRYMWFFKQTNQIPIFRFHDGFKKMKRNLDSFQHVYDALKKGARVIIFCEGHMKWEKKLHNLQLGAARMAVGAYTQDRDLDIYVVPIGINYEDHLTFRRYVKISIADPIRLADHTAEIDTNQRHVLRSVTDELGKRLKPEVIHIGTENHYELGNKMLALKDNNRRRTFFPFFSNDRRAIKESIDYAARTAILDTDENSFKSADEYSSKLGEKFIYRDYALTHPGDFNVLRKLYYYGFVVPLGVLGVAMNGLPLFLSNRITHQRTTVPEFVGSVKSNLGSIFYFLYSVLVVIAFSVYCWHLGLASFFVLLISGLYALYYWDRKPYWRAHRQLNLLSSSDKEILIKLRSGLNKIF